MVGLMVVMATSFRTYVSMLYSKSVVFSIVFKRTVVFSAPDSMAGLCGPMPLLETPGHSQASLAQSVVGSLWNFVCALQESVSLVLWKFCNEIPLVFKVKFPGSSQSLC